MSCWDKVVNIVSGAGLIWWRVHRERKGRREGGEEGEDYSLTCSLTHSTVSVLRVGLIGRVHCGEQSGATCTVRRRSLFQSGLLKGSAD